jgi:hypothetical protein
MSEVNVYTGWSYSVSLFETTFDQIRASLDEIERECEKYGFSRPSFDFESDYSDDGCVFHVKAYKPESERDREIRENEEKRSQRIRRAEDYKLYLELKKQFEDSSGATNDQ